VSLDARRFLLRVSGCAAFFVEGERHPEIFPSARMLVEAPYIILYETVPDTDGDKIRSVKIVRVSDGRRDLRILF